METTYPVPVVLTESNETLKCIYSRRAVRKFKDKQVSRELIGKIIDAGRMAPTAMNKQPLRFYVLTNKKSIDILSKEIGRSAMKIMLRIGLKDLVKSAASALLQPKSLKFFKGDFVFHGAPAVIFITAPDNEEWSLLDAGACMQNMMLAAKALGLDTCPVGLAKFISSTKDYFKLGIPENEKVVIAVILGYGDEVPEIHERKKDNITYLDNVVFS